MTARIFHADHVFPGDAPPLADAKIVVGEGGVVERVAPAAEIASDASERIRGVVFPGLVNAHTHLELSALRGKVQGGRGFVRWLEGFLGLRREHAPEDDAEAIDVAVDDLVRFGTVAVGDVTNTLAAVGALARRSIEGCIFHEVFGQDRGAAFRRIEGLLADLRERYPTWPSPSLRYAPAPHTLYTTHEDAVRALIEAGTADGGKTSLHLAEHAGERRAIEDGDGPLVEWLEGLTKFKADWPKRPLFDHAEATFALRPGVLLVHLTEARAEELSRIAASGAAVVLCPRSNLFIEARLPPLLAVLDAGLEPALGTDSLASNTSLDVLAEAKALHDRFPSVPAWRLLAMATAYGARALGKDHLGRIAEGTRPGLFAIEGDVVGDPAAFVLRSTSAVRRRLA